jgi:hypothetical protein
VKRNVEVAAEVLDELLVAVALVAAEVEVAVGSFDTVAQSQQNAEQGDTVGTAAEGYEMQTITGQQPLLFNICLNPIDHDLLLQRTTGLTRLILHEKSPLVL